MRRPLASGRPRIAIIGAGRTGGWLALLLRRSGWKIAAVGSSRMQPARRLARLVGADVASIDPAVAATEADAILIAVPDRSIIEVAERLRRLRGDCRPARTRIVLHTSGAAGAEALSPLRTSARRVHDRGSIPRWSLGSFHPLCAFPPAPLRVGSVSASNAAPNLKGVTIAVDGDARAVGLARDLAASLGARTLKLRADQRARYHLAGCFSSNYVVTMVAEAVSLLTGAGLSHRRAVEALLPLLRSTLANLESSGLAGALTGPVARGDDATIAHHSQVLARAPRGLRALHREIVRRTARLAIASGRLDARALRRIERALQSRS